MHCLQTFIRFVLFGITDQSFCSDSKSLGCLAYRSIWLNILVFSMLCKSQPWLSLRVDSDSTGRELLKGTKKFLPEVLQKEMRKIRTQLRKSLFQLGGEGGGAGRSRRKCGEHILLEYNRDRVFSIQGRRSFRSYGECRNHESKGEVTGFCNQNISDGLQRSILSFSVWWLSLIASPSGGHTRLYVTQSIPRIN